MCVNKDSLFRPETLLLSHEIDWPKLSVLPPASHAARLSRRSDARQRQMEALFLVSRGFCLAKEIQHLLAARYGIQENAGSLRRAICSLTTGSGLLYAANLPLKTNRTVPLTAVRLTRRGIGLCRRLRWPVYESEWERMQRLHEKGKHGEAAHTCATLAFVFQMRCRGYWAGVMPAVDWGRFQPDAVIEQDGEQVFVEVELGTGSNAKWQAMVERQGSTAVCKRICEPETFLAQPDAAREKEVAGDWRSARMRWKLYPGLAFFLEPDE